MKTHSSNNKKIIAMWSGPRNISTAMMRAWENRPDTIVVDEPLYGYYLAKTGKQHPMTDEIIADQGSDGNAIIKRITQLNFAKKQGNDSDLDIFYQKHMCHHILDDLDLSWLGIPHHVFLIRSPEDVITSYAKRMDEVNLQGLGFTQQAELFDRISDINGEAPLVVNSVDVLINPEKTLSTICQKIGIPFYQAMLSWPAGERDSDGVWADHWYANVRKTTGFNSYQPKTSNLPLDYAKIAERAQPYYEKLKPFALSLS